MKPCTVEGCHEPHAARGLCHWHYGRVYRYGDQAALAGPRPIARCSDCGARLPRTDMQVCMACRPEPECLDQWTNPLVCECPTPDADPARNWGECSRCRRKPLALMAVSA